MVCKPINKVKTRVLYIMMYYPHCEQDTKSSTKGWKDEDLSRGANVLSHPRLGNLVAHRLHIDFWICVPTLAIIALTLPNKLIAEQKPSTASLLLWWQSFNGNSILLLGSAKWGHVLLCFQWLVIESQQGIHWHSI